MNRLVIGLLLATFLFCPLVAVQAAEEPSFTRKEDVIYGRKFGVALTMDVFTPKQNANGLGIVFAVSGGWFSSKEAVNPGFFGELLKRGYTVFAVLHGSQPKFTVPEVVEDMNRALRFIRTHAAEYKVDPEKLGMTGASAGGHLSLMIGTAGKLGDPKARDPVDRASSRVQAVACFFPPSDFLNFGVPGHELYWDTVRVPFKAALDYREIDKESRRYFPVTDEKKRKEIAKLISPIYYVTAESPPTLILHGDKDDLVPIQQAEIIVAKFKEAGVPTELVVRKGFGHGWPNLLEDMNLVGDWFDKYLQKKDK